MRWEIVVGTCQIRSCVTRGGIFNDVKLYINEITNPDEDTLTVLCLPATDVYCSVIFF